MAYPYSFPSKSGQETSPDALCHVGEVKLTNFLCTFFLDFCPWSLTLQTNSRVVESIVRLAPMENPHKPSLVGSV